MSEVSVPPISIASLIREIGRGKKGARDLDLAAARELYRAMLAGQVPDLELGAIVLAMRIKGESINELAGFLEAAEASFARLKQPFTAHEIEFAPIVIPSYNGSRKLPNLTPLLVLLLAREGVPVLVHGVRHDKGRITTAEILSELGVHACDELELLDSVLATHKVAFVPIEVLSPPLTRLLNLRARLGLRNSTHTLVKILRPFDGPALHLCSYTHPEYLESLSELFLSPCFEHRGDMLLMRGTEGEVVANATRGQQIDWFHGGERTTVVERDPPQDEVPALPPANAVDTAAWIRLALRGEVQIPEPILRQVAHCKELSRKLVKSAV